MAPHAFARSLRTHSTALSLSLLPSLPPLPSQVAALFSTTFNTLRHAEAGLSVVRATEFTLPAHIDLVVAAVFGLHGLPLAKPVTKRASKAGFPKAAPVTPAVLKRVYNVSGVTVKAGGTVNKQVRCTLCCTVWCAVCCVLCTVYCVLCAVYCVLCAVYCVLCTVYCVLCTVYCVLCTVYCVLCTVYCVLCTVYCVL